MFDRPKHTVGCSANRRRRIRKIIIIIIIIYTYTHIDSLPKTGNLFYNSHQSWFLT